MQEDKMASGKAVENGALMASGPTLENGDGLASGEPMENGPLLAKSPLRHLHDTAVSVEKLRIALGNRVSALQRGVDDAERPVPEVYVQLAKAAEDMEALIDKGIADELETWAVWREWLRHVKGIGPSLAGQMLALLLPPIPTKGPSSWYKAAGLVPEERPDGLMRLPRARAGEGKITYHPWLRRCLYNVATSFVRNGGYYREVYEQAKARLLQLHEGETDWPPIRVDRVARWKTVKMFLAHTWEAWCEAEGIPARRPYIVDQMGHQYIPRPMPTGNGKI
jgi:hypothetical protein